MKEVELAERRGKLEKSEGSVSMVEMEKWVSERIMRGSRWVQVEDPCSCSATETQLHCWTLLVATTIG